MRSYRTYRNVGHRYCEASYRTPSNRTASHRYEVRAEPHRLTGVFGRLVRPRRILPRASVGGWPRKYPPRYTLVRTLENKPCFIFPFAPRYSPSWSVLMFSSHMGFSIPTDHRVRSIFANPRTRALSAEEDRDKHSAHRIRVHQPRIEPQ